MSFTIQVSKGFVAENCGNCAELFWIRPDLLSRITTSGRMANCRDCQIAKGFVLPAWPCARRLTEDELTEFQVETKRASLAYEQEEPEYESEPDALQLGSENTMPLSDIRDRLKYYLDVTRTSGAAFARAAGVPQPTVSAFLRGHAVHNQNRFKIVAQMEKKGWFTDPDDAPTEIKAPPVQASVPDAPEEPQKAEEPTVVAEPKPQEQEFAYPYPDPQDDTYKLIVNTLSELLWKQPDHPKHDEIERQIQDARDMADAPEGYYPWSYVRDANPINKLTQQEKLTCIRTLPLPIAEKLFPSI